MKEKWESSFLEQENFLKPKSAAKISSNEYQSCPCYKLLWIILRMNKGETLTKEPKNKKIDNDA